MRQINADEPKIQNVVFVHRYSYQLVGGSNKTYPDLRNLKFDNESVELLQNIDRAIHKLASSKQRVYVLYPIPALPTHITKLIDRELSVNGELVSIEGTDRSWYEERNSVIINHFKSANYPDNVVLINPANYFCGSEACFSTKGGILYTSTITMFQTMVYHYQRKILFKTKIVAFLFSSQLHTKYDTILS